MRSTGGGSPTTLGVLLYAIGAATAQPTGLFSDASACGKLSKTCDALASARAVYVHDDGRAHAMGVLPDGTVLCGNQRVSQLILRLVARALREPPRHRADAVTGTTSFGAPEI